jgi:release factor glutamine methyltransferase
MTLASLQEQFHKQLGLLYDRYEVDAIFYTLTEHFLNFSRMQVSLNKQSQLQEQDIELFTKALNRLQNHEPVQYITGLAHFYGLTFKVNEHTLIPRPETEELVDWAIRLMNSSKSKISILDVGTGSGCIAISLAKNLDSSKVNAIDISEAALNVARENAASNQVEVKFIKSDVFNMDVKSELFQNRFDLIISNPPYVRELEKAEMKSNVLNFEPAQALFVPDSDALKFYKVIVEMALQQLKPGGFLLFEINQYLSNEMYHLLEIHNFESIELKKDLSGNFRMIKAVKPSYA